MAHTKRERMPKVEFNPSFFKDTGKIIIKGRKCYKEDFLAPGLFLTDEFKTLILPYVSSVLPAARGTLNSLDFLKEMTLREAFYKKTENVLTPDGFAVVFLALFSTDKEEEDKEKKLLKAESFNLFYVKIPLGIVTVWVDPDHKNADFSGCGIFVFGLDDDERLSDCRVFV